MRLPYRDRVVDIIMVSPVIDPNIRSPDGVNRNVYVPCVVVRGRVPVYVRVRPRLRNREITSNIAQ